MTHLTIFPLCPPVFPPRSRVGKPSVSGHQQPWAGNKQQEQLLPEEALGAVFLFTWESSRSLRLEAPWGDRADTHSWEQVSAFTSLLQHVLFASVFPTGQRTDCSLAGRCGLGQPWGRMERANWPWMALRRSGPEGWGGFHPFALLTPSGLKWK